MNEEEVTRIIDNIQLRLVAEKVGGIETRTKDEILLIKCIQELQQENKQLKEDLRVSQSNEETYCLEMQEITKILGLDEHTLFDDVKQYVKNQISILTELEEWLNHKHNDYKVLYKMYGNPYFMIEEYEKILKKVQDLKKKYELGDKEDE